MSLKSLSCRHSEFSLYQILIGQLKCKIITLLFDIFGLTNQNADMLSIEVHQKGSICENPTDVLHFDLWIDFVQYTISIVYEYMSVYYAVSGIQLIFTWQNKLLMDHFHNLLHKYILLYFHWGDSILQAHVVGPRMTRVFFLEIVDF